MGRILTIRKSIDFQKKVKLASLNFSWKEKQAFYRRILIFTDMQKIAIYGKWNSLNQVQVTFTASESVRISQIFLKIRCLERKPIQFTNILIAQFFVFSSFFVVKIQIFVYIPVRNGWDLDCKKK